MVPQLVHMRVVLGHDGDGVALLADDEAGLLLRGVPQVDAVVLTGEQRKESVLGETGDWIGTPSRLLTGWSHFIFGENINI